MLHIPFLLTYIRKYMALSINKLKNVHFEADIISFALKLIYKSATNSYEEHQSEDTFSVGSFATTNTYNTCNTQTIKSNEHIQRHLIMQDAIKSLIKLSNHFPTIRHYETAK